MASIVSATRTISIKGIDADYAGVHTITVGVVLARYPSVARYD